MIDVANHLAPSTWSTYSTSFNRFDRFERAHPGIRIRRLPNLDHPDDSPAVPAEWAQQEHVLNTPKGNHANSSDRVSYDTSRKSRSALGAWTNLAHASASPGSVTTSERGQKTMFVGDCLPTDELSYTLMSAGMSKRLGSGSTPPAAITSAQVYWQDSRCKTLSMSAVNDIQRLQHLTAGAANSGAWLTWLRSNELFSLTWEDLDLTPPELGSTLGLAAGNGCIAAELLPETKTNRTSRADLYVSWNSASGLSLGTWLQDLRVVHTRLFGAATGPIFRHLDGECWTGSYFLENYLHPWLNEQRRLGDPMLQLFADDGEDSISRRFFSMGTYRRGGRSHVQRKRPGCIRRATPAEIYEHGRWAQKQGSEAAIVHYNEMSVEDKLDLTLLYM